MQMAMTMANATASTKPTMLLKVTFSIGSPSKCPSPREGLCRGNGHPAIGAEGVRLAGWLAAPAGLWSDPARPKSLGARANGI